MDLKLILKKAKLKPLDSYCWEASGKKVIPILIIKKLFRAMPVHVARCEAFSTYNEVHYAVIDVVHNKKTLHFIGETATSPLMALSLAQLEVVFDLLDLEEKGYVCELTDSKYKKPKETKIAKIIPFKPNK